MPDSWWLKVKRAQKHMVDINREALRYASGHPYEFTRVQYPDTERKVGYRIRITEQPDPMTTLMLGDFIHNLRSALDYIIFVCVPRQRQKSASFPILSADIFAKDSSGTFVINDTEGREHFETAIQGLCPKARALVVSLQPYHRGPKTYLSILGIISRLENADKHRQLITIGGGVQNIRPVFLLRGAVVPMPEPILSGIDFAGDGTIVGWPVPVVPYGAIIDPSEVNMKFTATAKILIKITRGGNEPASDFHLRTTMLAAIAEVRKILRLMEPFVRW